MDRPVEPGDVNKVEQQPGGTTQETKNRLPALTLPFWEGVTGLPFQHEAAFP